MISSIVRGRNLGQRFLVLCSLLLFCWFPSHVQAELSLPPGERTTDLGDVLRGIPQKEAYERYDPPIGRNFDITKFWMRGDLRVRPEWRRAVCFGGGSPIGGACNRLGTNGSGTSANPGSAPDDYFVQQWARLGLGYDLSPDVNFYLEILDTANWGDYASSQPACSAVAIGQCRLGIRAGYVLIRNVAGVPGLSIKAGRQYVVFGNQRLFGHFDWSNTGYSHDGVMLQYGSTVVDSYVGWFRSAETDLSEAAPYVTGNGHSDGRADGDFWLLYNQIKSVPGFIIEPYYVLYQNNVRDVNRGLFTPKAPSQLRHMVGIRLEMRKGNWDLGHEMAYQFGRMADGLTPDHGRNLRINAWASGSWIGYTKYVHRWKPRVAIGFDYASGDGDSNCVTSTGEATRSCGGNANTFENFYPTNFLHVGFMLNGAWRNMVQPSVNVQARPSPRDHVEVWAQRKYLASARDNWYRGSQAPLVFSSADNTVNHVGDEIDAAWTHIFADGKISLSLMYGHFFPGAYVRHQLGTSSHQDWGIVQLWTNF
ncbi:alginate export family protein [Nitrospira sp. Nam74]